MCNIDERRLRNKAKKYGMSIKAVQRAESVKKCQICGSTFTTEKKYSRTLDHCHSDNRFRGVICNNCNLGLGYFGDSTKSLSSAISYLEKYKQKQGE